MKYKVEVTVTAQVTYEVEVEASSESKAEDIATGMWRTATPDDFQVEKGYITNWEVDSIQNLTWECEACEKEIPQAEYEKNDFVCDACFAEQVEEDQKREARLAAFRKNRRDFLYPANPETEDKAHA